MVHVSSLYITVVYQSIPTVKLPSSIAGLHRVFSTDENSLSDLEGKRDLRPHMYPEKEYLLRERPPFSDRVEILDHPADTGIRDFGWPATRWVILIENILDGIERKLPWSIGNRVVTYVCHRSSPCAFSAKINAVKTSHRQFELLSRFICRSNEFCSNWCILDLWNPVASLFQFRSKLRYCCEAWIRRVALYPPP